MDGVTRFRDTSSITRGCKNKVVCYAGMDYIRAFQKTGHPSISELKGRPETQDRKKEKIERLYVCIFCANIISSPENALEINGRHHHTFTNPSGITFCIGSFSEAPGCNTAGEPTTEFTWFPGFQWSFALCSRCRAHMGWFYQSGMSSFYGLILDNLKENY